MTMHYLLKAAMDGMLEHGLKNVEQQGCDYTCEKQDATGIMGMSASPLFDPHAYLQLENRFTGGDKAFTIVGNAVEDYPAQFKQVPIEERL